MAHFATTADASNQKLIEEMHHDMTKCVVAFNDSNEREFQDCIDPKIVLFSGRRTNSTDASRRSHIFAKDIFSQIPPHAL